MSDLDTLKDMLERAGIAYREGARTDGEILQLTIEGGYIGFVTECEFDKHGNLKDMGAYE